MHLPAIPWCNGLILKRVLLFSSSSGVVDAGVENGESSSLPEHRRMGAPAQSNDLILKIAHLFSSSSGVVDAGVENGESSSLRWHQRMGARAQSNDLILKIGHLGSSSGGFGNNAFGESRRLRRTFQVYTGRS